jgi:hypothetical protein
MALAHAVGLLLLAGAILGSGCYGHRGFDDFRISLANWTPQPVEAVATITTYEGDVFFNHTFRSGFPEGNNETVRIKLPEGGLGGTFYARTGNLSLSRNESMGRDAGSWLIVVDEPGLSFSIGKI